MKEKKYTFSNSQTRFYFDAKLSQIHQIVDVANCIFIVDKNLFALYEKQYKRYKTIVISPGEQYKVQATVDDIMRQLIDLKANRSTVLIGMGGGVVTDITGYVAATYMRGIDFGFIPTTILGMVDASVGGKNGIDVGIYKNIIGTVRQPSFILHDYSLLKTLPDAEWANGFAEIIKHACIKSKAQFSELSKHNLAYYRKNKSALSQLIQQNVGIKIKVVQQDEFEKGDRQQLNFGHTLGHAIENEYKISHGNAVAIGMVMASQLSAKILKFNNHLQLVALLQKYELPTSLNFNMKKVMENLLMDKKRKHNEIHFILLARIGKAAITPLQISDLEGKLSEV